jgi:hypothetical protein
VRPAAKSFVSEARRLQREFTTTTTEFPQPDVGDVIFYTRSDASVVTAAATEQQLSSGTHKLSALYFAGLQILHGFLQLQKASDQQRNT